MKNAEARVAVQKKTTSPSNVEPVELNLQLASGTMRAQRFGRVGGRLTICVHGLSANSRSYDFIGKEIAEGDRAVVAIDLRGRGWSSISGTGTYGWRNHARDILEVATELGADTFDYVGHSMGAFIGMEVARLAPSRVQKLVLIDAVGIPEAASLVPILAAVQRLGASHADADSYVEAVKALGTVTPWNAVWDTHYRYDLIPADRGVKPRTDRAAVLEDMAYGATQNPRSMWTALSMKTLLVRSGRPLGLGFIVNSGDAADFVATVPGAQSVEVDANHYGVMTHPETARSIRSFLS